MEWRFGRGCTPRSRAAGGSRRWWSTASGGHVRGGGAREDAAVHYVQVIESFNSKLRRSKVSHYLRHVLANPRGKHLQVRERSKLRGWSPREPHSDGTAPTFDHSSLSQRKADCRTKSRLSCGRKAGGGSFTRPSGRTSVGRRTSRNASRFPAPAGGRCRFGGAPLSWALNDGAFGVVLA